MLFSRGKSERHPLNSDANAYYETGRSYYHSFKDLTQSKNPLSLAINEYIRASELDDSPDILMSMAHAYLLNGQLDAARKLVKKLEEKAPTDKQTCKKLYEAQATLAYRDGNFELARTFLRKTFKTVWPWQSCKLHFGMAGLYAGCAQHKHAPLNWLLGLGHFLAGCSLLPLSPSPVAVKAHLSLSFLSLLRHFSTAERMLGHYSKLYQKYPGLDMLPIELGRLYQELGQYAEAEFWFSRAIYRHPLSDEGYRHLANLYRNTDRMEQLVETLERWLEIRPNSGDVMLVLSQVKSHNPEQYDAAITMAKQSLLFITHPETLASAYMHLGNLYQNLQQFDAAMTAFQAALHIQPRNIEIYVQLGTLYYDRQEYQLSQHIFEKALAISPENAKILCNLGYLAWMQGNVEQAQKYYHRSIELDPTYDIALNNLGVLYLDHIGNIPLAMALFDQTLSYNPHYALCHYNKGRAYSFMGETIEAAKCFQRAQEFNETSRELDQKELTERIKQLFENT